MRLTCLWDQNEITCSWNQNEMRLIFHKMRWDKIKIRVFSCEMRLIFHEMKWNETEMKASSCKMRWKIFSWNKMRSNLCEIRTLNFISSQNWDQNKTKF